MADRIVHEPAPDFSFNCRHVRRTLERRSWPAGMRPALEPGMAIGVPAVLLSHTPGIGPDRTLSAVVTMPAERQRGRMVKSFRGPLVRTDGGGPDDSSIQHAYGDFAPSVAFFKALMLFSQLARRREKAVASSNTATESAKFTANILTSTRSRQNERTRAKGGSQHAWRLTLAHFCGTAVPACGWASWAERHRCRDLRNNRMTAWYALPRHPSYTG